MTTANPLFSVLRQVRTPPGPEPDAARAGERCELCTEPIPAEHGHLVDLEVRSLLCACRGCYLLFTAEGAGGRRYRAVPDRYLAFPDHPLTAAQWEALQIPVGVAFFFINSSLERVAAFYPGPAGATESLLPLETWEEVTADHPGLATIEPDVEAVLVRSEVGETGGDCFVVPIDACYELVGELRKLWRGFDGGREANDALDAFFERVRTRARA